MNELTNKKTLLDRIHELEGAEFECDEKAILDVYREQEQNKSGLAIKVLSVFGGLLTTFTFLGFLDLVGLYDSALGLTLVGIAFIVAAVWLNKKYDKRIMDACSVSLYSIGLALLAFGLEEMKMDRNIIALLMGVIALCSLFITQNYIVSFISISIVSGSFLALIFLNEVYNVIHLHITFSALMLTYLFLHEAKFISSNIKMNKLYNPSRIGLIISLLSGLIAIGKKQLIPLSQNYIWLSSIVMIVIVFYLLYIIIRITKTDMLKAKIQLYLLSGLLLMATLFSPAVSGTMIIILLSFLVRYKTGLVIGIISFIYFIAQYYYDLNFTLLTKSIILLSSGVVFLLFYLFMNKGLTPHEKI